MADFLTIDGNEIEFTPGESILQVALRAGIEIPHLCYHPRLRYPQASCRACVVEVEGSKSLVASCAHPASRGLVVHTNSERARKAQKMAIELILSDHPADCLCCEESGRCTLHTWAYKMEAKADAYAGERPKRLVDDSNPFFQRDYNKCISCGNCVQACSEIECDNAITMAHKGFDSRPAAPFDGSLQESSSTCTFCGCCVQVCPTGALVDHARKGKGREWELEKVRTTCTYCGYGCTLVLRVKDGRIINSSGDEDSPVNKGWLCVKGRYGVAEMVHSPERLSRPLIATGKNPDGEGNLFREATWEEALELVAKKFKEIKAKYGPDSFGLLSSSRCTNEENYLVQKLSRAVIGTNNVDNCARLCHAPTVTGLSKAFGTSGGTNPLSDIEGAACLFVVGSNPTSAHPVAGARVKAAAKRVPLIVADPRRIALVDYAALWLQQRIGTDIALLMGIARVILEEGLHDPDFIAEKCEHFEEFKKSLDDFDLATVEKITNVPKEKIVAAARLYASHKPALIMYSLGITEHSHGTENVLALANLALLTGNVGKASAGIMPMRGQNNVQGSCDMGAIPGAFHGYQYVVNAEAREKFEKAWSCKLSAETGLYEVEMFQQALEGKVKALYAVGVDPAYTIADANQIQAALEKMEFVVFQDIFLTGSAKFADVVLPGASFTEKDGTFTNLERRVQRVRKAIEPLGEARPDWLITCQIARQMGASGFDFSDPSEILDEVAALAPNFAGLSFARLEKVGIQWPCFGPDHEGTPRLHVGKFNTPSGKGNFSPLTYRPSAEQASEEYPFILTTGRNLYHYHLAMTSQVKGLMTIFSEEEIWINPEDAEKLAVKSGDKVKVSSRRGNVVVKANITDKVSPGTNYMSFHFYKTPTNVLTNLALDPPAKTPEYKVTAIKIEKANSGS